jgi:uncharacterized protein YdaU (DUF1376 family)
MKLRHADFYPDEFLVGVVGLNPAEIGAYWVTCSLMYSRGGPIADDDAWIARACGCHIRTWRTLKERLIAAGKLVVRDGFISNSRVLREIEKAQRRLKQSRDAAEASANARRESAENDGQFRDNNGLEEAPARIYDELTTNHQPPTNQPKGDAELERRAFDAFVAASKRHSRWPVPSGLSDTRRKLLKARITDAGGLDEFLAVLAMAEQSEFIRQEMTGWCLDWFLKAANFTKVREGNYNRARAAPQPEATARPPMQI